MRRCVVCGRDLDGKRSDALVCSQTCANRFHLRRRRGEPVEDAAHLVACAECGRQFLPVQWRMRFCTAECCRTWAAKHEASRGRDASVQSGKLTEAEAEKVCADMQLDAEARYAESQKWTRAMRDYARRLYERATMGGF